jgi:VCBS repeat-containing protein
LTLLPVTAAILKLNAGESMTGTVAVQVPDGVHLTTVKWTPDSGMSDSTATSNVG